MTSNVCRIIQTLILAWTLLLVYLGFKSFRAMDETLALVNTTVKRQDDLERRMNMTLMIVRNTLDNIDLYKGKKHGH